MQKERTYDSPIRKPKDIMRQSEYKQLRLEESINAEPSRPNLESRLESLLASHSRLPNAITRHRLLETVREMAMYA